jgi:hypothetical protein
MLSNENFKFDSKKFKSFSEILINIMFEEF